MKRRKDSKGRVLRDGETQRKTGEYMYRYYDISGKRKTVYSWKLVDTDKLPEGKRSEKSLRALETDISNSLLERTHSEATLNNLFETFMDIRKDLRHNTRLNYKNMYKAHVESSWIGSTDISRIKYSDIVRFYSHLSEDDRLQIGTIRVIDNVLRQLFDLACRDELIRTNPCIGPIRDILRRSSAETVKGRSLTREQQNSLIKYVNADPQYQYYAPMFVIFLGTGLRIGEALALTWDDVDFNKDLISVNKSISYKPEYETGNSSRLRISKTKTVSSIRTIPMTPNVKSAFLIEKERCDVMRFSCTIDGYTRFIFFAQDGKLLSPERFGRLVNRVVKSYNDSKPKTPLPDITPHTFRHTFCTRLCESGVNPKVIQELMGHKNFTVTMDIYTTISREYVAENLHQFYTNSMKSYADL